MPPHVTELPSIDELKRELKVLKPHIDLLEKSGFNIVRLPVMWKGIEPVPNDDLSRLLPEGEEYLSLIKEVIDELYKRGLAVIVDFHQDLAHEMFGGDGFPDWAVAKSKSLFKDFPAIVSRDFTWGSNYYDIPLLGGLITGTGTVSKWVRKTMQEFWLNSLSNDDYGLKDYPARTHLEKSIGLTAKFFAGHPAVLGYQPFNEPHPVGLDDINRINSLPETERNVKYVFEEKILPEFYKNCLDEIRRYDKEAFIFTEPRMNWTTYSPEKEFQAFSFTGTAISYLDTSAVQNEKSVFSFHYYDPWMLTKIFPHDMDDKKIEWPEMFRSMKYAAETRGLIPFLTEFGASQDWQSDTGMKPGLYKNLVIRASIDLLYKNVERFLLNSTYWNYDLYNTKEGKDNWNDENFSLLGPEREPRQLDIATRPYAIASPAEPVYMNFNAEKKIFILVLKGIPLDTPAEIFVPKLHYKKGFEVVSSSGQLEFRRKRQKLYWRPSEKYFENILVIRPLKSVKKLTLPDKIFYLEEICRERKIIKN
jgi:endoglycosylceramidase